ncbi:MAG: hypothetical protein DCC65_01160 [Planctomycetota bacterium]|nr:MAG: hypothetical protein DCC65_01160 [Planctomycetota bacterium]
MYRNQIVFVAALVLSASAASALGDPIPCGSELELVRTLMFPGDYAHGIAWHQGELWIVNGSGVLRRIDPLTGEVLATTSLSETTHNGLGSDGASLFMSYDPGGNTLFRSVIPSGPSFATPTSGARDLTHEGGGLWYADFDEGKIVKMSTTGGLLAQYPSPDWNPLENRPSGIEWDGEHLLLTNHDRNTLYLIRPGDGVVDCEIDLSAFNPTIAAGLAWDPASMQLYAADNEEVYVFGVVSPVVNIVTPAPGDQMLEGCVSRIRWTSTGISNPDWKFFLNQGPEMTFLRQLFPTPVNEGNGNWYADWTVDTDLLDDCYYDIVVKDDSTVTDDHSGHFCITCRTIDIARPMARQVVQKGCNLSIRWQTQGCQPPNWKFFLDKNGVFQEQLQPIPIDEGNGNWRADWNVPANLIDGVDYSIVVKDDSCVTDRHSAEFAILDTIILGDMNGDASVDGMDVQQFVTAAIGN